MTDHADDDQFGKLLNEGALLYRGLEDADDIASVLTRRVGA